jgi:hypothetical protein
VIQESEISVINGEPLAPESLRMLDYLRTRSVTLGAAGVCERVRAAARELEGVVAEVNESKIRLRPFPNKWNIAEVVDHISQTQIRAAEELRHLLAGSRPPAPPVYESLRSGASEWAPWRELVTGLQIANEEMIALLQTATRANDEGTVAGTAPTARTILVANRTMPDGQVGPQIFVVELGWKEYALVQRLHLLDHRTQIKKLLAALSS